MRLLHAQVQNFRSIVDSGIVDIDDRVTVIIGRNEQGKTTFLRGLSSCNEKYAYAPSDLPHHLRPQLEAKKKEDIPIVTIWLVPDVNERAELKSVIADIDNISEFKVTRYYDGHYKYSALRNEGQEGELQFAPPDTTSQITKITSLAETFLAKLPAHATRLPEFAPHVPAAASHLNTFLSANFKEHSQIENLIKTLSTALTGVPAQDGAIQADVAALNAALQVVNAEIKRILEADKISPFKARLPKFVFHSILIDHIPNDVSLAEFVKDPAAISKGMANLCRAAGLSIQKIQELSAVTEASLREPYEDHHKAAISGAINEFWTQQIYTVYFRIERERLSVSIEDKTYGRRIPPFDRSDGFRWYLSFYCTLLNEVSSNEPTVLLLDNPGLELHPDGQRDIKRSIEEKHSASMQVIYVTHSPAMIDPFNLEQVRRVDLLPDMQGTKVRHVQTPEGGQFDLLEPVRSAIGASLVTSLMANQYNVLAEGAADRPILEAGVTLLAKDIKDSVLVSGSVAESLAMLPAFFERAKLPYIVYVDFDHGGRSIEGKLKAAKIPETKIVSLRAIFGDDLFPGEDFELEDIVSDQFYARAVADTYPERPVIIPAGGGAKRTKRYEEAFKTNHQIGFNKRRVADKIKQIALREGFDEESATRLQRVIDRLVGDLKAQTEPKG
ncbi:MAG: AAA family ATPase [Burkholderiales bacterium]